MSDLIDRQSVLDIIFLDPGISEMQAKMIIDLPSADPLTEEDYTELRDRFGEYVEFVVRDMVLGKGERWRQAVKPAFTRRSVTCGGK